MTVNAAQLGGSPLSYESRVALLWKQEHGLLICGLDAHSDCRVNEFPELESPGRTVPWTKLGRVGPPSFRAGRFRSTQRRSRWRSSLM